MFILQLYLNAAGNPATAVEINRAVRADSINLDLVDLQNRTVNGIAISKLGSDVQRKLLVLLQAQQKGHADHELGEFQNAQAEAQGGLAESLNREKAKGEHITDLERQIFAGQETLEKLTEAHRAQIAALKEKHAKVMQALRETHDEEKEATRVEAAREMQRETQRIADAHERKIEELTEHHNGQILNATQALENAHVAHQEQIAQQIKITEEVHDQYRKQLVEQEATLRENLEHQKRIAQHIRAAKDTQAEHQKQIAEHAEEAQIEIQRLAERYGRKMRLLKGQAALRRLVSQYIGEKRSLDARWEQLAQDAVPTQAQQERKLRLAESSAKLEAAKAGQGPETDLQRALKANIALHAQLQKALEKIAMLESENAVLGGENERFRNDLEENDAVNAVDADRLKRMAEMLAAINAGGDEGSSADPSGNVGQSPSASSTGDPLSEDQVSSAEALPSSHGTSPIEGVVK